MNKSAVQIIITILLAVIAAALTILVLEKAGIITCQPKDVRSSTAEFHRGEENVAVHHEHSAACGHTEKSAEHHHEHSASCGHAEKSAEHHHKH